MPRHPYRAQGRLAGALALAVLVAAGAARPGAAIATAPGPAGAATAASPQSRADAAGVARYWTPARMRAARPLDLTVDGRGGSRLRFGSARAGIGGEAGVSFVGVPTPAV